MVTRPRPTVRTPSPRPRPVRGPNADTMDPPRDAPRVAWIVPMPD